jgi:RNA recognition motif-containing protein
VKVLVVRDNKGKSKGFGYVEFESSDAADKAIALSGQVLEGRSVIISPSTRGITHKRPVVEPPKTFEREKDKTNDYFRNLILQKQKVHK